MPDIPKEIGPAAAELTVTAHQVGESVLFTLPNALSIPGRCTGQIDGASCGAGCTCLNQQPHYDLNALKAMGIHVKLDL